MIPDDVREWMQISEKIGYMKSRVDNDEDFYYLDEQDKFHYKNRIARHEAQRENWLDSLPTMPEPDWSKVDPKYKWAAMTPNYKGWVFCEAKLIRFNLLWIPPQEFEHASVTYLGLDEAAPIGIDWRQTLQQRLQETGNDTG